MSTGQEPEDDSTVSNAVAERKALRNVDWHVLPIISLYYIISVIDR